MRKKYHFILKSVTLISTQLAVVLSIAEIGLRIAPDLVAPAFLVRFPSPLKAKIAGDIGLPTGSDYVQVTSSERSDKGSDLFLAKPNTTYFTPADKADAAAGAIETLAMDSLGFCNPAEQSATRQDIVVIGGSLPNCAGVAARDNFTQQLQSITGKNTYNLAVGGTGPFDFVEVFKRFGLALKPHIVVMAYGEANELRDCMRHLDSVAGRGHVARQEKEWGFPFSSSYALSFLKAGIEVAVRQAKASFSDDFTYSVTVKGSPIELNIRNGDRDELKSARDMAAGKLSAALCEPAIAEFVSLGKEHNFVPVVMLVPAAYGSYENSIKFNDPRWTSIMADYRQAQRTWLAGAAREHNFVFIDPTELMHKEAESSDLLYFPSNAHLTVAGHSALARSASRLLAEAIDDFP